ncbi:amino acid-binding protein [Nocardia africana]|uniref:Amino acid-binding protein n=1 Tax=Nocardia africana TaxID=134964 RepID=A0ABW6NFA0_9NOCA
MRPVKTSPRTAPLACEVCGRLPHPRRARLALAKLTAILPVEFTLHALVLHHHLPAAVTVSVLAVTTTVLVIWLIEPSAMRLLAPWMHAPALRSRDRLHGAELLWRIRVRLHDTPGQLESLTAHLARRQANILTVHVHHLETGVLDELVVATPPDVSTHDLTETLHRAGGHVFGVWPATALALIDGQTKALSLAARVTADPDELPLAVAELLDARYLNPATGSTVPPGPTVLELTAPSGEPLRFLRDQEPFTPAEIARAHRLHELARIATRI